MILLNGELLSDEAASISPLGDGFMYGAGVFTTMRVTAGRVEFWREHAERLSGDVRAIGLQPASEDAVLRERCAACIAGNRIENGGLKVVWFADAEGRTSELISPRAQPYGAEATARGFRLMTMLCGSREGRELSRHKTLNYLEHARAKRAAVAAGFDDALWIDERGVVLEGATTNVFAVLDGEVLTPDEKAGLLPGVARRVLLGLAETDAPAVRTATLTEEMLESAQEVFVTNVLMGVMPVRAWGQREYDLAKAPVTQAMAQLFARTAKASCES
jgi:branched-subunit amino acid aminotransferase/4-amino-4-deoxychorismate lyase